METGVVSENSVAGVANALALEPAFMQLTAPNFFGAKVTRNDFTDYVRSVRTSNDYNVLTELSVLGKGNFWGLACNQGGFDPTTVRRLDGSINPVVGAIAIPTVSPWGTQESLRKLVSRNGSGACSGYAEKRTDPGLEPETVLVIPKRRTPRRKNFVSPREKGRLQPENRTRAGQFGNKGSVGFFQLSARLTPI